MLPSEAVVRNARTRSKMYFRRRYTAPPAPSWRFRYSTLRYTYRPGPTRTYRKAIRIDIESYYSSKLKGADKDSKKIWSIINEVLDRGTKSSNDPSITLKYQKNYTHPQQKLVMVSTNTSETWPQTLQKQ
jgi:hypothetical protein